MKKIYTLIAIASASLFGFSQDYVYTPSQEVSGTVSDFNFEEYDIEINTPNPEEITYKWTKISNSFPSAWSYSLCDHGACFVGVPSSGTMSLITLNDYQNGIKGFFKLSLTTGPNYGSGTVEIYVYDSDSISRGDTVVFNINLFMAGDVNTNGIIDSTEFVGDSDGNGMLGSGEIAGDASGDGVINNDEISGDINGDMAINGDELAGDINGNGEIDNDEIAGDKSGDEIIDDNEIAGDIDGDGVIAGTELIGDINGNGSIGTGEILGDANGNGQLDPAEVTGITENKSGNISVYPNPAQGTLFVNNLKDIETVRLYNILGETVKTRNTFSNNILEMNISDLKSGIYLVSFLDNSANTITQKVVIK